MKGKCIALGILALGSMSALVLGCAATGADHANRVSAAEHERRACAEVPEAERAQGPFARRDRIERVETLRQIGNPKLVAPLSGVAVTVRATPGVTEQWMDRVIECHLAYRANRGATSTPSTDPLDIDDTRVAISPTATGFRIAITSDNPEVARAVIESGRSLIVN
jgi:hypothetical protein